MKHKIPTPFYKRKKLLWAIVPVIIIALVLLAFRVSPWPGALIVRSAFRDDTAKTKQALQKHAPSGVSKIADQQYAAADRDAYLDVYYPTGQAASTPLPVVIWTHGGAWLSGDKTNVEPYYRLLASKGYVVVSLNYTLAPARSYPEQIYQLNQAHGYVLANSQRFHADVSNIFLAGDSAGSQLSAQLAALITSPTYANEVGVAPAIQPTQLKGVLLNCGIYKMEGLVHPDPTLPKLLGWGDDVTVWAYAGTNNFKDPIIRQMSPYYHVTSQFPPTYITGGNKDPLTNAQSKPFADKLQFLGVPVDRLFYEADHQPGLPHEYQFNLDNSDGQRALEESVRFLKARSSL